MNVAFIQPRPELKPYIKTFWVLKSTVGFPQTAASLAAPNGSPKLIILCENSLEIIAEGQSKVRREGLYFVGNRDVPVFMRTSTRPTSMIGVEFYPHRAFPVFGMPMLDVANHVLDSETAFGPWGRKNSDTLRNLPNMAETVRFIQVLLIGLLERNHRRDNRLIDFCVKSLEEKDGRITIKELEQQTGYTRRYLELLFKHHVGLPPKVLAGIFRFQKFYRKLLRDASYDVLRQELYDDYCDQAHFTREFKKMTGYPPGRFNREVSTELTKRLYLK